MVSYHSLPLRPARCVGLWNGIREVAVAYGEALLLDPCTWKDDPDIDPDLLQGFGRAPATSARPPVLEKDDLGNARSTLTIPPKGTPPGETASPAPVAWGDVEAGSHSKARHLCQPGDISMCQWK